MKTLREKKCSVDSQQCSMRSKLNPTHSSDCSMTQPKNKICLWYNRDAVEAAKFYSETFPDSSIGAIHIAPSDNPSTLEGEILTVEFTVMGIPCIGLNGGPGVEHNWAFSFQVATNDQAETDRYWNAILDAGGEESQCGWCRDRWGINWQITPTVLTNAFAGSDRSAANEHLKQ